MDNTQSLLGGKHGNVAVADGDAKKIPSPPF